MTTQTLTRPRLTATVPTFLDVAEVTEPPVEAIIKWAVTQVTRLDDGSTPEQVDVVRGVLGRALEQVQMVEGDNVQVVKHVHSAVAEVTSVVVVLSGQVDLRVHWAHIATWMVDILHLETNTDGGQQARERISRATANTANLTSSIELDDSGAWEIHELAPTWC